MISDKDKIKSKKRKENQTKLYKYIYIDAKNQCKFWVTWWDHVESTKTIGEEYERIRIERGGQDRYSSVFPQAYATIVFHRILPLPCPLITIVTIHWRFTLTRPKYITVDDTEKNSQTALHKGRRRSSITSRLLKPPLRFIIEAATRGWRTLCKFIRPYDFQMGGDRRFYAAKMDTSPSQGTFYRSRFERERVWLIFFLPNVLLFISARFIPLPFFIDRW